jgi:hypothetical protein
MPSRARLGSTSSNIRDPNQVSGKTARIFSSGGK